jgi:hypothetical protein
LLGFAEAGVLLGRKTFLIDQVDPAERTTYVAFANTAMGVVTLLFGFLGILAQVLRYPDVARDPDSTRARRDCGQLLSAGTLKRAGRVILLATNVGP